MGLSLEPVGSRDGFLDRKGGIRLDPLEADPKDLCSNNLLKWPQGLGVPQCPQFHQGSVCVCAHSPEPVDCSEVRFRESSSVLIPSLDTSLFWVCRDEKVFTFLDCKLFSLSRKNQM